MEERSTIQNQPSNEAPNSAKAGLLIVAGLFILAVIVAVILLVTRQPKIEDETPFLSSEQTSLPIVSERTLDQQIQISIAQYDRVAQAADETVSWEEYLIELDLFIAELSVLNDLADDELVTEAYGIYQEVRTLYGEALPDSGLEADIDQEKINEAALLMDRGQTLLNEYLTGLESEMESDDLGAELE